MDEILERLARLEALMENHLKSHETLVRFFIAPIAVGIALLLFRTFMR